MDELTAREIDVMRCLAQGMRTREITNRLGIAYPTLRTHFGNIFRKLGVHNRTQALVALGWVVTPGSK